MDKTHLERTYLSTHFHPAPSCTVFVLFIIFHFTRAPDTSQEPSLHEVHTIK